MVTPTCYSPADVRRYSSRMGAYSSYPERRAITYPIHADTRTSIMSDRDSMDDVTPQRKRIAVACGRCRKRKIRCSGDTGNGGPCTNCKNAGFEPCQFLRVASQETPMKQEPFSYSLEASRQYQARGSSVVPAPPVTASQYPDGLPMAASDPFAYRPPATFAYSAKPFYPLSSWGHGYAEDSGINYTMYPPSYPAVHDSDYSINYRIGSGTTGKTGGICVDTEPNYAYSGGTHAATLVHRPGTVTADSTNLTFQNMAAGVSLGDRVLPTPVVRSMTNSAGASSYRNDSGGSLYSSSNSSNSSSRSSQASTSGTSPTSAGSETPSSYTSYESSSMPSGLSSNSMHSSSAVPSYPPMTLGSQLSRSSGDLYSQAGGSDASSLFTAPVTDPMRPGPPDMTYRYTDTTTPAQTAAATAMARRDLPNLNGGGLFALGHHSAAAFMSHGHHASYMLPTGDAGGEAAGDNYRKSAGTLRA
ncbi:hypothetical protein FZEAL_9979 [Fusarium zealandicum]|uniref:Zn(2)-C6 fungal-type domain-containing protein n=1 Tax=Fusarium zealandicum TaxID=1053134 RepID=A0A8H4XDV8_9HYPO|nr:hypothetical protein FZEAL_9979 [Fusarium zealandicum]